MSKFVITATWDDVPHLPKDVKDELLKEIPPYQRDARTRGVPQLGAGAIYPIAETDLMVDPFEILPHWPRAYALDVGWDKTAAIWGARDNQQGIIYLYSEHYRGHAEPAVNSEAIKSRGAWIPGVVDPAANGRSQVDGRRLIELYRGAGLDLDNAANAEEAGIYATWQMMSAGRVRVFKSLANWWTEFRSYQRDELGRVHQSHKYHLMACTRYFMLSGISRMKAKPQSIEHRKPKSSGSYNSDTSWMGN